MAYTSKHLNSSELDILIEDGNFQRLYDDSKEYIENGNYYLYDKESDISEDDKYNHWCSLMSSFASGNVVAESTQTNYVLAVFKDDLLCLLSANYYDTADTSYNYCHALLGRVDGSKKYSFGTEFFEPQASLMKSLGADKMIFWTTQGGSFSFRAKTAQTIHTLFNYDELIQTEEEEVYEINSAADEIPTEDGSTKAFEAVKLLQSQSTTIKTIRPLK